MNRHERRRQQKTVLVASPHPEQTRAGHYFPTLIVAGAHISPGTVAEAIVCHDDWCDLLNSRGACNCTPEVRVTALGTDSPRSTP